MFRKQVKCYNCGFLAWYAPKATPEEEPITLDELKYIKELEIFGFYECRERIRKQLANGTYPDVSTLTCARRVWSYYEYTKEQVSDLLSKKRKCPYYFPYNPSYSPFEHRELQREAKTQRLLVISTLLGALIGALAAITAQLITR